MRTKTIRMIAAITMTNTMIPTTLPGWPLPPALLVPAVVCAGGATVPGTGSGGGLVENKCKKQVRKDIQ